MSSDTPTFSLVSQLSRVGLRPSEKLVNSIVAHGAAAREPLLALATKFPNLKEDLPTCLGPLHALRILGEFGDPAIIEPLLAALPVPIHDEEDIPSRYWATEVLSIIGRVGEPALEVLRRWAADDSHGATSRAAAVSALSYVAVRSPQQREAVLAELRQQLATEQSPEITAGVVNALANLGDAESYRLIMDAYKQKRVDQSTMPAAVARQLLFDKERPQQLMSTNISLWERYDNGPHLDAQAFDD